MRLLYRDEFKTDKLVLPTALQHDKIEQLQFENGDSGLASPASSEDMSSAEDTEDDGIAPDISDKLLRVSATVNGTTPLPSPSPIKGIRVDWASIAEAVRRPRLVFDGRNIVEAEKLEALGFQVHTIGGAGSSARRRQ